MDYFQYGPNGWKGVNCALVKNIVILNSNPNSELKVMDLTGFVNLTEIRIGSHCCKTVEEVNIVGLFLLTKIIIGEDSFTKEGYKPEDGEDCNRHFCLRDCSNLTDLSICSQSFMDYSVCEMIDLPRLTSIRIGDLYGDGNRACFYWSSLELKSAAGGMR